MHQLLLILLLLLFTACSPKKFYTLGDDLSIKSSITLTDPIDVVKVSVPKYLKEHKIVRQVTPYQIELIDKARWLIPMEKKLTQMLIEYLQQSMNNPNVHLYPWEANKKATKRVSIEIKKFIASEKKVMLKATYKIVNLSNQKRQIKLFETSVATKSEIESMMQGMEKAYLQLLLEIKKSLITNK